MLTSPPHLYIRRPSPTTAEFTVTTCPPLTLPLRLALLTVLLLRIITIFLVLLALYTQYGAGITTITLPSSSSPSSLPQPTTDPYVTIPEPIQLLLLTLSSSPLGQSIAEVSSLLPTWAFLGLSIAALYIAIFRRIHTTESVLVLQGLGIQTSSSSSGGIWGLRYITRLLGVSQSSLAGREGNIPACLAIGAAGGGGRFIPTAQIQDVLINEAFRGFEVRYYLVVVVEGEEDVVVVFPGLLPRREIVETVWREVKGCLYEQADGGGVGGVGWKGG